MISDKIKNEIRIFFYLTIEFVVLFDIIGESYLYQFHFISGKVFISTIIFIFSLFLIYTFIDKPFYKMLFKIWKTNKLKRDKNEH